MTPQDTTRIKQAAEAEYPLANEKQGHLLSHQKIEFNKQAVLFRTSHRAGATAEAQHWTPIVADLQTRLINTEHREDCLKLDLAAKDLAIKELVEGLGALRHGIFEHADAVNEFIDQLIAKHK